MGLHLCYELRLPEGSSESDAIERIAALRERALALPVDAVSDVVRLTERTLAGPSPLHGLAFVQLEDVVHVSADVTRIELHRRRLGIPEDDWTTNVEVPPDVATVAHGFAVAPGHGCEPATFGLAQLDGRSPWWWHCCCKTQYASLHGDDNLLRCHGALVTLLDAAPALGLELVVRDETGYWESRDPGQLVDAVTEMNRVVARFAGRLTDAVRDAGGDSRQVDGSIFEHPDFERLEGP